MSLTTVHGAWAEAALTEGHGLVEGEPVLHAVAKLAEAHPRIFSKVQPEAQIVSMKWIERTWTAHILRSLSKQF